MASFARHVPRVPRAIVILSHESVPRVWSYSANNVACQTGHTIEGLQSAEINVYYENHDSDSLKIYLTKFNNELANCDSTYNKKRQIT